MRTLTRLLPAVFVLLAPLTAQSMEIRPGIEAGVSMVTVDYDREMEVWDTGYRPDFHVAATMQFEFGPQGSVLAGLRYSGLGNEVDYAATEVTQDLGTGGASGTFQLEQRYLGIPLGLRWDLARSGGPYLFGGVETAFLLNATVEYRERQSPTDPLEDGEEDITDVLHRVNAVAFVGAGLALTVASHEVEISARYGHGLTDVGESDQWFSTWTTREFSVGLGWRL